MAWVSPHFSVVVPTHNRPDSLVQCLGALASQQYARSRFDVIIVDDGSSSTLDGLAARFQDRLTICVLRQDRGGAASARNLGAERARGEYLAFTDDDCCPETGWLRNLAASCMQFPNAAITGKTVNVLENNPYASAAQLLIDYLYLYYNATPQHARFLTSNNFALPAAPFRLMGGFHSAFSNAGGEDREFCDRWLSRNHSVVYSPESIVFHSHSMTLAGFIRQQFNYGRGAFHFNRLRSFRNGARLSIEPLKFYLRMFHYPYRQQKIMRAHLSTLLFALSQGVNFAGFALESLAYGIRPGKGSSCA